jgi:hypothetical protein
LEKKHIISQKNKLFSEKEYGRRVGDRVVGVESAETPSWEARCGILFPSIRIKTFFQLSQLTDISRLGIQIVRILGGSICGVL